MVKIIMHGCNGHMGQVITGLVKEDANAEIIAGIDMNDNGQNDYPVFKSLAECDVPADVVVDFSSYKHCSMPARRKNFHSSSAPQASPRISSKKCRRPAKKSRFSALQICPLV